jgi:pyruvate dehydrogenase E1 component alpha subunit/2-oxoisovalerate dehydrogenase E1 component alpha subunit
MVDTVVKPVQVSDPSQLTASVLRAFRTMLVARILDEKLASLYRMGKIQGGVFLGRGQEALSVSIGQTLRRGDVFAPLIRDAAGRLAFGETVIDALRTYLGSRLGPMRGRDGNVHRGRPKDGMLPMISHLGAMISVVNGSLFAFRYQGIQGRVGVASIGDGATSTGSFHEAANQACVEKLPLVIVVANNHYAYSTPNSREFACASLVDRAIGYGMRGWDIDGTDLFACLETLEQASEAARAGQGPQLIVASLLRLCGHGEHDDASYVEAALRTATCGRDCLQYAEQQILERGLASANQVQAWRLEAANKIEEALAKVQREPAPTTEDRWCSLSTTRLCEGLEA